MDVKWFFVIIGIFLTFAILTGMYFIGTFISLQTAKQYEQSQQSADQRFNNSTMIHNFLYYNITDLKKKLDPILDTVGNATQMREEQITHYNQTATDFKTIKQILQIKLEDHKTLGQVNETVNHIYAMLHSQNDTGGIIVENVTPVVPKPTPLPAPPTNNDTGPIIENITGKNLTTILN